MFEHILQQAQQMPTTKIQTCSTFVHPYITHTHTHRVRERVSDWNSY